MGTTSVSTRKLLFRTLVVNSRPMMIRFGVYEVDYSSCLMSLTISPFTNLIKISFIPGMTF